MNTVKADRCCALVRNDVDYVVRNESTVTVSSLYTRESNDIVTAKVLFGKSTESGDAVMRIGIRNPAVPTMAEVSGMENRAATGLT